MVDWVVIILPFNTDLIPFTKIISVLGTCVVVYIYLQVKYKVKEDRSISLKQRMIFFICVLLILFGCYNLIWYLGEYKPYYELQKEFPEIEKSGVKIYTDEDYFQYSVSVPDYLLWNGNLAITEREIQYGLIIWIRPFQKGYSKGILFNDYKDLNTQIMLKNSTTAEEQEDQSIVNQNGEIISMLFDKANRIWMLELE